MNKVDKAGKSEKVTRDVFIEVPRGWSRGLEKDNVVYISPTSECLRSKEEVVNYLVSHETCKCGLECPLHVNKIFNFDATVPSRHFRMSNWDKDGHATTCMQTLVAMNAYKYKTPERAKTGGTKRESIKAFNHSSIARPEQEESIVKSDNDIDISKVHLPSFETFTILPEQKLDKTLQGQAKAKKSVQSKRLGCYKRKSTTGSQVLSAITSVSDQSNKVHECTTVHSTSTPISHSYVKNNAQTKQSKGDVVSSAQHTPIVSKASARQEEQRYLGLNLNPVSLLSFPSTHLNASSYLASLSSTGGSANMPNRPPSKDLPYFSHAEGMPHTSMQTVTATVVHPSMQTVMTAPHTFANTPRVDYPSFTHKPVTTVFSAGATSTTYLSSSMHTKTNQKPTATKQESSSPLNNAALPSSKSTSGKFTLVKSKGGFSMKNAGNVKHVPSVANNLCSPVQYKTSTATTSLSVTCAAPASSAMSYSKTSVAKDMPLVSKSVASTHGQQTSRVMDLSEKGEPSVTPRAVYAAAAMMTHADKNKQRPSSTAASSKAAGDSVNQPFQYCGILLPATGMVPQVQVAGGSGIQLQQAGSRVDPNPFANVYALQGIPYANNVGTLGNSGVFGMTPGTVLPYVLGIAQTATTTKSTAATPITSKICPTSSTVVSSGSTTSTGSAAIAAAYSAFVSIAPASGPASSNYSQQLMNLVNNYNSPYWQQILSHGTNANALAYQIMQMNQYAALRGSAGQAAANVKTSTAKSVASQAKQTTTTCTTAATSASGRCTESQGVATTPVALVVVGPKDLSSASATSNKTAGNTQMAFAKTQLAVTAKCAIQKPSNGENTCATETSNLSTSECKVNETPITVVCTSTKDDNTPRTCEVTQKQNLAEDGDRCRQKETEEDGKNIPQISNNVPNKGVLSSDLNSLKNSENVNIEVEPLTLSSGNVESRTCESTLASTDDQESKDCDCTDSSINVTHMNHEEDISVDSAAVDKYLRPGDASNSRSVDTVHTSQQDTKENIILEESELEEEKSAVNLVRCDGSGREDECKIGLNSVVHNGEAESCSNDLISDIEETKDEEEEVCRPAEFTIGDVVWAQARGLPSWPGKIVDERDVGSGRADHGKKWVMWFGDHNFSQVEVEKLKTLSEGLKTLDDKGKKRKYRGKKTRIGLEQAIGEALEELDQKDRLRSRQGPKAKKRRLRV